MVLDRHLQREQTICGEISLPHVRSRAKRRSLTLLMRQRARRALWQKRPPSSTFNYFAPAPLLFCCLTKLVRPICSLDNQQRQTSTPKSTRKCRVYNVTGGLIPYQQAWLWQQRLLHERMAWQRKTPLPLAGHDVFLLLEHPSVYTLGRGSSLDHLRFDPSEPACPHEVRRTERGGEVTWHGPGQLVGYPVMDLNHHKKDLHWYLRQLEEVVIRVLAKHGLEGERETEHTGVWVGGAKVAAIGLNASRWITSHGFALNVNPELVAFEGIVPCGIQDRPVTRLCDLVSSQKLEPAGAGTAAESVRSHVMKEFEEVFGVEMEVEHIDVEDGGLEDKLFPAECDPKLLERLGADCRRQLELTRRR